MAKYQAIRGMNDLLPEDALKWHYVEHVFKAELKKGAYHEIRMPILESTALFKRGIGDITDIVEKEMYTFEDRSGDSLSLRPEGTASCVRACLEHGLIYNQTRRLFYMGAMYRHERPQRGRYRQFHQLGVEVFGQAGPDIDAELIILTARFWEKLGISNAVKLHINTLGTPQERAVYREALVVYFSEHQDHLDEDSKRRLESNPMRILDSKNPNMSEVISGAPKMLDYLEDSSRQHFQGVCRRLDALNISYEVNPVLVRGLDYYTHMVFEWVTTELGAQGTICAGGRYDGLVEQFGGQSTPAVGFALGMERLILLMEACNAFPDYTPIDLYGVAIGEAAELNLLKLVETIKDETAMRIQLHLGRVNFKNVFKKAFQTGASLALVLGENELNENTIVVKYLREEKPQETIRQSELINFLKARS